MPLLFAKDVRFLNFSKYNLDNIWFSVYNVDVIDMAKVICWLTRTTQ